MAEQFIYLSEVNRKRLDITNFSLSNSLDAREFDFITKDNAPRKLKLIPKKLCGKFILYH